jgi:uncharacterized damage-inducible protein DinB
MRDLFVRLAGYNRWANDRIFEAAAALSPEAFAAEQGAFFGSIRGTLNHLLVTDRMWLARLSGQPLPPYALDAVVFDDLVALREAKAADDAILLAHVERLSETAIAAEFRWVRRADGMEVVGPLWSTLAHVFNHQTHHRGQVHDLLSRAGIAPPSLDLPVYERELVSASA